MVEDKTVELLAIDFDLDPLRIEET